MLQDRYVRRFPELGSLSLTPLEYARTVLLVADQEDLGRVDYAAILPRTTVLAMAMPASTSLGRPLPAEQLEGVLRLAQTVVDMHQSKQRILLFLEQRMRNMAPNVAAIVGTKIASQLVAITGGIAALAKVPAGNIHVLGRSRRKELAGFSLAQVNPHAGVIYECDLVTNTPAQYKTQAQRLIASKVALAARIDCQRSAPEGAYGASLRQEIIKKLEKLVEPAPMSRVKPIPPPPIESSKKRGGRRARRQKELYAQTQIRKMTNRLEFGRPEEEVIVGSSIVGLGELGVGSTGTGRLRAPVVDNRLREHIKREAQKGRSGILSAGQDGGSGSGGGGVGDSSAPRIITTNATSLRISDTGGIQIQSSATPSSLAPTGPPTRYFGTSMSFRK